MNMTDIYEIAEYTLGALTACGADDAQCTVVRSKKDELNVDGGKFSLMRSTFNTSISMKALKGGKKGVMSINQATEEAIDAAAAQCLAAADSSVADSAEQIAPFTAQAEYRTGVFEPDLDRLFDRIEEFLKQTKEEYPKIILEQLISDYEHSEKLYMNTNGTKLRYEHGEYSFNSMFSAHEGEKSSSFNGYFCALDSLDKPFMDAGMQRQLLEDSEKQIDTVSPEEKFVGKVIYSPDCFNELLATALGNFASDGVLIDGTSPWKNSLGTKVASDKLTLRSVPTDSRTVVGQHFTSDGYPAEDIDIIKDGVLKTFILSQYGANKTGFPRSLNSGDNLEVLPGDISLEDMIKGIDKGLIINRFSGGHPSTNGDFSGVAKNSFIIENGRIGSAVSETMISGNIIDMLNNIVAISKEQETDGMSFMPWAEFDGVTVSGK